MRYRYPDFLKDFRCLAGQCPDTCCAGWEIVLDTETAKRYGALEGPLGDRLRKSMTKAHGEISLRQTHGRCPMLTEENLCALICDYGEGSLCTTCREHPRFTEVYGGLSETALSLSCPAAASLLLQRKAPLTFSEHTDDSPPQPNDLDPELFRLLLTGRDTAFAILQDRSRSLADRLALFLCFAHRLDGCLDRPLAANRLCALYRDADYQTKRLLRIRRLRRWGTLTHIRQLLLSMEHLTDEFPQLLCTLESVPVDNNPVALEQLAVHYVFRRWLKAACGTKLEREAAACVVSVLAVSGLSKNTGSPETAARIYAKEVEHNEDNLSLLLRAMSLPHFSLRRLLSVLEVPHAV